MSVNKNTVFKILNDSLDILKLDVIEFEDDSQSLKHTVFHIPISFKRTGILPRSPYCVTIQPIDLEYLYNEPIKGTEVCLEADLSKVLIPPVPEPLVQGQPLPPPPPKPIDSIGSQEMSRKRKIQRMIQHISYPKEINVHRTAQNFSRLAQPEMMRNLSGINLTFKLDHDPTDAIAITRRGGIIYVRNNLKLYNSPGDSFR